MSDLQYEPFGEPVEKYAVPAQGSLSDVASKIGVAVFWTLAAGIVIARAVYFNPNIAETFLASLSRGLHAVLAG